jgi:hypothetical protein
MPLACPFGRGLTGNHRRTQQNVTDRERNGAQLTLRYGPHPCTAEALNQVQGTLVVLIADPGEGSFSASGAVLRSPAGRRYAKQSRNGGLFVHENQCCWSGGMDWQRSGTRHPGFPRFTLGFRCQQIGCGTGSLRRRL